MIDVRTLSDHLAQDRPPRVLDVRTPAEFGTVHIPGAYNVPLDTLTEHRDEIVRRIDDPVVLVCRSGVRAGQAEQALEAAGLTGLQVLDGGMQAWEQAGAPVRRGRTRWALERQVRLVAGTLVASGVVAGHWLPRMRLLAGGVGTGLAVAALTDTCAMGSALSRMPWNRDAQADPQRVLAGL